jgi:hypothetical protein
VGCCARRPVDPELHMIQGPPLTPDGDDADPEDTDLWHGTEPDPVPDAEIARLLDDGGREPRIAGEDYEIGGEGG